MSLSIIIVNWNTRDILRNCLRAVYSSTSIPEQVIVVDNGSTDGSQGMVANEFPGVQIIENTENVGFGRANNQAVPICRGEYILLLNSDAFVMTDTINVMVRGMNAHPEAGIAGANLLYPDDRPQTSSGKLPTFWSEVVSMTGLDKASPTVKRNPAQDFIEVGYVCGACLMVRKSLVEQIGLFDESFFMFNEEVDLCCRAQESKWKVILIPAAQAYHIGGGSTGSTPARISRLYQGKLLYFRKHYGITAEERLRMAFKFTTYLKIVAYWLLAKLTLGRIRKDGFWRQVRISLDTSG